MIAPWSAQAFNQVPHSANQIHGDALAKEYGFTGGLVPGVTVSAYLIHPAVEAWGLPWLTRGCAHVRVGSPLYDEDMFRVRINEQSASAYTAELVRPGEIVCATAQVSLPEPEAVPPAPVRRGDPLANFDYVGPAASFENWAALQHSGARALRYQWGGQHDMHSYLRDASLMPALLQAGAGGYANMSFILGCSNWILASNAYMNPWVHLETRSQNYRAIAAGTVIIAEMTVVDFYAKKGHEFVDVSVALFDESDAACLSAIELRAIYKLRGA